MQRESSEGDLAPCHIRDLRWGEEVPPVVKWAFWMLLMILIFIGVGGYTGAIPLYLQPTLLYILVSLLVILGALMIIGWFKSFDRSGWLVFLGVLVFMLLIGILSIVLT